MPTTCHHLLNIASQSIPLVSRVADSIVYFYRPSEPNGKLVPATFHLLDTAPSVTQTSTVSTLILIHIGFCAISRDLSVAYVVHSIYTCACCVLHACNKQTKMEWSFSSDGSGSSVSHSKLHRKGRKCDLGYGRSTEFFLLLLFLFLQTKLLWISFETRHSTLTPEQVAKGGKKTHEASK